MTASPSARIVVRHHPDVPTGTRLDVLGRR